MALIGVVLLLGMAANLVIAAAAAHRSAQAAADLAALAGAQAWQQQSDATSACGVARTVAEQNDAGLTDCRLEGDDLLAVVRVEGPQLFGHGFEIVGRARAGPEAARRHRGLDARAGADSAVDDRGHGSILLKEVTGAEWAQASAELALSYEEWCDPLDK